MTQKTLSPRQHRWLDVLNEFSFKVNYIPGETNVVADALLRIYSDEPIGIVRAGSEYVAKDEEDNDDDNLPGTSRPIYTGAAAIVPAEGVRRSTRLAEAGAGSRTYSEPRK
ncbi:hypothetical protein M378DRAFT_91663, partial [Amanita muscaria Koide BX008]